ncbi:hypothetical protein O6H91_11G011100 [Diphasiastrum complanatum]|nr:hypothetical protein O6H91_Y066500 [Diphasiastrum complanatum]KAJ7537552.1 hypothetical protein O6H91_11G011100 [Diphasiastrum complanatum]
MSAVPAKVIVPALLSSFAVSYLFFDLARNRKLFGGTVPRTLTKEWLLETEKKFDEGWAREASEVPVVINPISRQNYRLVE